MIEPLRLAIVGCGAAAGLYHLPVLAGRRDVHVTLLVDKEQERARELARRFGVADVADGHDAVWDKADAAIVAVPHRLHAAITIDLLDRGTHVLVEKPMAMSVAECDAMIAAARQSGAVLAVGMQRRFAHTSRYVKDLLAHGLLGPVSRVELREGAVYTWPVTDASMLRREAGGGVVTGSGVHSLDLLLWWLGEVTKVAYLDDAMGGVEADCEFRLELAGGVQALLEFSRTRVLRNSWQLWGAHARLDVSAGSSPVLRLAPVGSPHALTGPVASTAGAGGDTPRELLHRQLDDFVSAIRSGAAPLVTGEEGRRVVALLEMAWASRRALRLPWLDARADARRESDEHGLAPV